MSAITEKAPRRKLKNPVESAGARPLRKLGRKLAPKAAVLDLTRGSVTEEVVHRYLDRLRGEGSTVAYDADRKCHMIDNKAWHLFLADPAKMKDYEAVGYEPVGESDHFKGMPLTRVEQERFEAHMDASETLSRRILQSSLAGQVPEDAPVRDRSGDTHRLRDERDSA